MSSMEEKINQLKRIRENGVHEKYIEHIRYPRFRNLENNTRIDFDFPITFLVGKNGGGKSSTLQSLYGCPLGYSLGDYWFTTELDPIKEFESERNCLIYGFKVNGTIQEVLKQRIYREGNPDYWEPSKPLRKYGMTNNRVSPISKEVEYIDFRSELSAFDKFMHFTSFSSSKRYSSKQDYLRFYTKKLKSAIDSNQIIRLRGKDKNKIKIQLSATEVQIINHILGKQFSEIELIEHCLFKDWGVSIRLKNSALHYSEAFAGSGETAIVMLVHRIVNASNESLILLDEPETSLHSGAQKRLMSFIIDSCIQKKHQYVISTHSPFLLEKMPNESIKVFSTISSTGRFIINKERNYYDAFHELEIENTSKKVVLVEDRTAKLVLDKVIESMGAAMKDACDVKYLPGGAKDICQRLTTIMEISDGTSVIFDGDQKLLESFIDVDDMRANEIDTNTKLKALIKMQTGCDVKFYYNGGNNNNELQKVELSKKYLRYFKENVFYFPTDIPEDLFWDPEYASECLKLIKAKNDIKSVEAKSNDSKECVFNFCLEFYHDSKFLESCEVQFISNWINKKDQNFLYLVDVLNRIITRN